MSFMMATGDYVIKLLIRLLVVGRLATALGRYVAYTPWGFRRLIRWLLGLEDLDKTAYYNGVGVREYLESMGARVVSVALGP